MEQKLKLVHKGHRWIIIIRISSIQRMKVRTHLFTLSKNLSTEVNGWYHYKTLDQLQISEPMLQLNFGLSNTGLMKGKGSLKINARDPFNLQHSQGTTRYGNIDQKIYNRWDTRMYGFTFSYQFGKGKSSQSRKQSGLQDEQNRVGVGQ